MRLNEITYNNQFDQYAVYFRSFKKYIEKQQIHPPNISESDGSTTRIPDDDDYNKYTLLCYN